MKTELLYLTWSAVLCLLLWLPYIGARAVKHGLAADEYRMPRNLPVPDWAHRAHRTHMNLVENLAPFAALVLVAHALGVSNSVTAGAAAVFFWSRVAHAIVHIAGTPFVRTPIFSIGWIAQLVIAWQILAR
jgi:uncharacterized MAPEG superfamily protein